MVWDLTNILLLMWSIVFCNLAGIPGAIFTFMRYTDWYMHLKKPPFHPPFWVFGSVWTVLYTLIGISLYILTKHGLAQPKVVTASFDLVFLFVLNSIWPMIFLGFQSFRGGIIAISLLWLITIITIYHFALVSSIAAILLIPYLLWISFIAALNLSLWELNKP